MLLISGKGTAEGAVNHLFWQNWRKWIKNSHIMQKKKQPAKKHVQKSKKYNLMNDDCSVKKISRY